MFFVCENRAQDLFNGETSTNKTAGNAMQRKKSIYWKQVHVTRPYEEKKDAYAGKNDDIFSEQKKNLIF